MQTSKVRPSSTSSAKLSLASAPPSAPDTEARLITALVNYASATAQWKKQRRLEANDLFLEFEERWLAGPHDSDQRAGRSDAPLLFCLYQSHEIAARPVPGF